MSDRLTGGEQHMDDVNMNPKPVPTGEDTTPEGGVPDTPPPPESQVVDHQPSVPDPEDVR